MKIFLLPLLLALPLALSAQLTQQGLVLLQNSGKTPLSGVELTALGANPAVSLTNGAFSLGFGSKAKGDYAAIYAKKPGYEVVNQEELRKTGLHPRDTVHVVMCLAGELDRRRLAYYQINEKNISKAYNDKIAQLRAENRATDEALSQLGEDYKIALKQLEDYNERFVVMNLDEVSGLRRNAFLYFEKGRIDSAIAVLQDEFIAGELLRARKEIALGRDLKDLGEAKLKNGAAAEQQAIQAWMDKAEFYVVKLEFGKAEFYYEKAVKADTTNLENVFTFAYFLDEQKQYSKVEKYYLQVLNQTQDSSWAAVVLNDLGNFYSRNHRMSEAGKAYIEALNIYRQLDSKAPEVFLPNLATALNNLGAFYYDNYNMPEAEKPYNEAAMIRRQLVAKNPDAFLSDLAMTLNNLGNFYALNQKPMEAESAFTEALEIRHQLADKNKNSLLHDLFGTLNDLSNFYSDNYKMEEAEKTYKEALEIQRQLALKNPDAFLPDLAGVLNNLGMFYYNNKKTTEAEKAYIEAAEIYRQIIVKNPDAFLPGLAMVLNNLGNFYIQKRVAEAETAYVEAQEIYRQLAVKNPDAFLPSLATTLNNLGNLYSNNNKLEEAQKVYIEGLNIRRNLAQKNPNVFLPDLAMILNNLGTFYVDLGKMPEAEKAFNEALDIQRQLALQNPDACSPDLASMLNNLGVFFTAQKKYSRALSYYAQALQIRETALLQGKHYFFSEWTRVINNSYEIKDSSLVQEDYTSAAVASRLLAVSFDTLKGLDEQIRDWAISEYFSLSWYALIAKDYVLAEQAAGRCLELDPTLFLVYTNMGHALLFQNKIKPAREAYIQLKGQTDENTGKTCKQILEEDFQTLEAAGMTPPGGWEEIQKWVERNL